MTDDDVMREIGRLLDANAGRHNLTLDDVARMTPATRRLRAAMSLLRRIVAGGHIVHEYALGDICFFCDEPQPRRLGGPEEAHAPGCAYVDARAFPETRGDGR